MLWTYGNKRKRRQSSGLAELDSPRILDRPAEYRAAVRSDSDPEPPPSGAGAHIPPPPALSLVSDAGVHIVQLCYNLSDPAMEDLL